MSGLPIFRLQETGDYIRVTTSRLKPTIFKDYITKLLNNKDLYICGNSYVRFGCLAPKLKL